MRQPLPDRLLAALTWPEGTYTYQGTVWRIRGISLISPDYIGYVNAPYYLEDTGTLTDAVALITGEVPNVTEDRAKRIAKALGLARRPVETPPAETRARTMVAAVIMGTVGDDGEPAFGYRPGAGIDRATADTLRQALPANDLAAWAEAVFGLSVGQITDEDVEAGKASSDDDPTYEPSTG